MLYNVERIVMSDFQSVQNQSLRVTLETPWLVRNHHDTGMVRIKDHSIRLVANYLIYIGDPG